MVFIKTRRRLYPSLFEIEHQGGSLPPHSRLKGHGVTLYNSRRWVSAASMSRSLINIDGQDKQDDLLMVWAACSGTRVVTFLSSTITFSSTRIPKTRSQAHGSPQTHTRSSSQSAFCAAASRPVYPEPFAKFGVGHEMGAECSCKITPSKGICTWLAMGFPLGARASRPHTCQGAAPAPVGR